MVELARRGDGAFEMRVGGDTFNAAIYMARLGTAVAYMTALGDDRYSGLILDTAASDGIVTEGTVIIAPGRLPGLYLIETTSGERTFTYWRERAPARELLELEGAARLVEAIARAELVYLSGVTLSLYAETGLDRLAGALVRARSNGGRVVLDSNYRPVGWGGDKPRAQAVFERFWRLSDIALPSYDDEQALWGDTTPSDTLARLRRFGAAEICIKDGARGAHVAVGPGSGGGGGEGLARVPAETGPAPLDTTAAGDSFNAAYVHARLWGAEPAQAAVLGNRLAGIVIQHPGAIAPRAATMGLVPPA
jgi:2-dehydro-3-deoxygluconokinase